MTSNYVVTAVGFSGWAPRDHRTWQHVIVLGTSLESEPDVQAYKTPQEVADEIKAGTGVYTVAGQPLQHAPRPAGETWYPGGVLPQGTDFVFLPDEPLPPVGDERNQRAFPWREGGREPAAPNRLLELAEVPESVLSAYEIVETDYDVE